MPSHSSFGPLRSDNGARTIMGVMDWIFLFIATSVGQLSSYFKLTDLYQRIAP